jgi:hypothetical protein
MIRSDRYHQQGFTLPAVLGLGFIAMLLVAALLERARSEQIGAQIQARSDLAQGNAEAGMSRLRALLQQHPDLALRDVRQWRSHLEQLRATLGNCALAQRSLEEIDRYAAGEWQDLPSGQYRLAQYSYLADRAEAQVTITGRTGLAGQESHYLLAAEISLVQDEVALPVLWTSRVAMGANQRLAGVMRSRSCPVATDPDGVLGIDREHLDGDESPESAIQIGLTPALSPRSAPFHARKLSVIQSSLTLPRPGDIPDAQGNYNYEIMANRAGDSIDLKFGHRLSINAPEGQRVNLYLEGNLYVGGRLEAGSDRLRIYGSAGTKLVTLEDSAVVQGLIHAPLAAGMGLGGGSAIGEVRGGLWLASWDGATHQSRLPLRAGGSWEGLDLPVTEMLGLRLDQVSRWQRRELGSIDR